MKNKAIYDKFIPLAATHSYKLLSRERQGTFFRKSDEVSAKIYLERQGISGMGIRYYSIVGVDINAFELEWCSFLRANKIRKDIFDQAPLLIHSANLTGVWTSPFIKKEHESSITPEVEKWFLCLCEFGCRLPNQIEALKSSIHQEYLAGIPLWKWKGHPLKLAALTKWLRVVQHFDADVHLSSLTAMRDFPYEGINLEYWCK